MSKKDYRNLSKQYREKGKGKLTLDEVRAYSIARMPATFASIRQVFFEIAPRIPIIYSFLDLGAGPGTGLLAAREAFPEIDRAVLIEKNPEMVRCAQVEAEWMQADVHQVDFPPSDLVLFGYSYGEMENQNVLKRAWEAAQILVLVEPGTPRGFEVILRARKFLSGLGGYMVAPCPHLNRCPLQGGNNWCHFSTRLERTREHKALKEGALGWEDEKYSYVVFSKTPLEIGQGRILGHPQVRRGHLIFECCTSKGIEKKVVSRKKSDLFKRAKKLRWGDLFPEAIIKEGEDEACN